MGGHLVHFTNDVQHNKGRIKFIPIKNSKGILSNEGSIKSGQSHDK